MDKNLLAILACPQCKGDVVLQKMFLTCKRCSLAFPVLDDVPDMLIDDAWPLAKAKKAAFAHELRL